MFIPGIIISILTFPGVIVHELAHQLFCRLLRIPVFEVKYFQFKNPVGYVVHEAIDSPWKNLLICIGPFILNTLLGMLIILPAAVELVEFRTASNFLYVLLGWLGFSVLMHAFPSMGDGKNLYTTVIKNKDVPLPVRILLWPVCALIYLGAMGSMFWLDALYAAGMSMLLPNLIASFM